VLTVNHWHQMFYIYTYHVVVYIYIFTFTQGKWKYLSNTLTQPHVNVLGHVGVSFNTKIIC
jgi:hypothetical protein